METHEVITTILASIGGSAVVVGGLAGWIGKLWADRIIESQKSRNQAELETLKSSLEITRSQQIRISDARFELYTDIWNVLQDLRLAGDLLWEHADREVIKHYRAVLNAAKHRTQKGRLILQETHYRKLIDCLKAFSEYRAGKVRLVEIRSNEELGRAISEHDPEQLRMEIRNQIDANGEAKQAYEAILEEVAIDFRKQLGLSAAEQDARGKSGQATAPLL